MDGTSVSISSCCVVWTLALVMCFGVQYSTSSQVIGVSDVFEVVNGEVTFQRNLVDGKGDVWSRKSDLSKLEVLTNDLTFSVPPESCVLQRMTGPLGSDDKLLEFQEKHQEAGFRHVYRDSMAVRPHCAFDIVIPHVNVSKEPARLKGEFCLPEHISAGAAVGDYDNDGLQDIFFAVFHGRSILYRNNGNGIFTDVTEDAGVGPSSFANGAGWVDVDQDGDLDLYVTSVGASRHHLYINYGGHFREEAEQRNCSMRFTNNRKLSGMTPNFGDFDNDGFVDIYVSEWILRSTGQPSASRLLRNKGYNAPGYFEDVTDHAGVNMDIYSERLNRGTYTFGASFTDFDSDGWPELLVTADYGDSRMFWNNGDNTFQECTSYCGLRGEQDAMGHAIGDWDNDGMLDWFSSAIFHNGTDCAVSGCTFGDKGNKLFRNLGKRNFEDSTDKAGVQNGGWGWGAAFLDFDNDGYLDIVMTNGFDTPSTTVDDMFQKGRMRLWKNLGPGYNGKTEEVSRAFGLNSTSQGRGLLKWDYDDDGDEDVVICNNVGSPFLYNNLGGNQNKSIRVQVKHRCAKEQWKLCDSYGARVQVISADNHTQTQEIGSSTHFLGQSEMTAHFGLGRDNRNVTVRVSWPAVGKQITYTEVPPNTRLRVVRPDESNSPEQNEMFSNLKQCPSLRVVAIDEQPSHGLVTINPDGKSVAFQPKPNSNVRELQTQIFVYQVALVPSPDGKRLTSNVTSYIQFLLNSTHKPGKKECMNGRRVGPTPTPTDARRLDGISNNKRHPWWGAAMETLTRDFAPAYADRVAMPAGACSAEQREQKTCRYPVELGGLGSNRPSPRNISNVLFYQVESRISVRRLNDLHAHFGQFLAHDTDFSSPLPRFEFQSVLNDVWLPIKVPKGDINFDPRNRGTEYLPFVRSTYNRCSGRYFGSPREQINKLSSFIDGSMIYGQTKGRNKHLRTLKQGKMKLGPHNILPKNTMGLANDNVVGREQSILFVAGDTRVNVQPGLIALHSLFVREHNRLCDKYLKDHPQASDEEIFQFGRRIVIAELQSITFREYLPALLGGTEHFPVYQDYREEVNAGFGNAMATAAFRFGHSQVNNMLWRLEEDGSISRYGHLPLRDAYFAPERVEREGGLEPILRGAVNQAAQEIDAKMVGDLRNVLFPVGRHNGLDLAALNIQRGRDHGLPDYNTVRVNVEAGAITKFTDITNDAEVASKLKELYGDVNQIDLWVGGLAEDHEPGSELGPTFRKILVTNFLRLRDGDRFWYERVLSDEEIRMVHGLTLSRIISLNTDFQSVPNNAFFSSLYCAAVKNHQCVLRDVTCHDLNTCQAINSRLRNTVTQLRNVCHRNASNSQEMPATQDLEVALVVGVVIACLLILLMVVIFVVRRLKRTQPSVEEVDVLSMRDKCFQNEAVQA